MDSSRSLETLYLDSTGMSVEFLPKKTFNKSIENYDGFSDILFTEYTRSEEDLTFIDTFQIIEAKNAADKVNMCRKLAANYGTHSNISDGSGKSIEAFCNMMSMEGAEQAAAVGANKAQTPEASEKKRGFFKTIFGAIAKFFKMIADLFKHMVATINNFFKNRKQPESDYDLDDEIENKPGMKENIKKGFNTIGKGANAVGASIKAGATKIKEFHEQQQSLRVRLDLSTFDHSRMLNIAKEYSMTATDATKLTSENVLKSFSSNDLMVKSFGIIERITSKLDNLLKYFGYDKTSSKLKTMEKREGKYMLEFEKYYKICEEHLIKSNRNLDNYKRTMKLMYNIDIIKETQWIKSVYKGGQNINENVKTAFEKSSELFSKGAETYSEISKQLAEHVDLMIERRTYYSKSDGSKQSNHVYDEKYHTQTNKVESGIRVVAALLRVASRIGKTVMEEYNHIIQTYNQASAIYSGYVNSSQMAIGDGGNNDRKSNKKRLNRNEFVTNHQQYRNN